MIVRPATLDDFRRFYGAPPPMTVRAVVATDENDEPVGVGGYYLAGSVAVAFTNHKDMRKRDKVKAARAFMAMLRALPFEVVAGADGDGTAVRHFGFVPAGELWRLDRWPR